MLHSAKRCIVQSTSCRPISMRGSANTTRRAHIRGAGLRQNPDAHLPRCDGEGEDDRGLTTSDTKTRSLKTRHTLSDRVPANPFFDSHDVKLLRVLTDRGSEYCGNPERHEYELYLAVEDIDHSRTKTKSPQTNGICERFHKTVLNEFYRIAFRKKVYRSIDELQVDLDLWVREYNEARPHQGRWCFGKTPMQTFLDAIPMTKEKMIAA